jgi:hypothetical protein
MNILLCFTAQWNPFKIYPSLPALQAFFKKRGLAPQILDLNIDFYNWLFSPGFQRIALERARPHSKPAEILSPATYPLLKMGAHCGREIARLRNQEVYVDDSQRRSLLTLWDDYLSEVSALYKPVILSYRSLKFETIAADVESIRTFCLQTDDNLFAVHYASQIKHTVQKIAPALIGLSVVGPEQVIPALTFCARIRSDFPSIKINLGGQFTEILRQPSQYDGLFGTFFDFALFDGNGEHLCRLVESLDHEGCLDEVPNLVFKSDTGLITRNPICELAQGEPVATDYSGFPFADYFHYDPSSP